MKTDEIRIAIIDDEQTWSKVIANVVTEYGYTVAWVAHTFEEAIIKLNGKDYDLILLDINLDNNISGTELGKMIHSFYKKPFIFITSNLDPHTLKAAIEAKPSAYLTKPFQQASLIGTLQSAINNFNDNIQPGLASTGDSDMFFVKQGLKYKKIHWANIVYLRSEDNYTVIFNSIDGNEYYVRSTLTKTMNHIIPTSLQDAFIQVNRAEAVNLKFVLEVTTDEIKTAFKAIVLTKTFAGSLRKVMNLIE
ncbi:hypothetical protein CJD36_018630 [Flavipsychrobacter stenotrophus]|uniref:Response regulatory domain-containing protein n=1 Tax=Flavipsychrobacter stenotrophus TaxID=2077091 RepID=A0A2S7SRU0_9BACT|nr:response regulator transcription factor [Flavipsychrobacter stenotrophus]PQJ09266.1 hypothetical protein CJD36_018630 [Flavipsychrobacter stenotrophus]